MIMLMLVLRQWPRMVMLGRVSDNKHRRINTASFNLLPRWTTFRATTPVISSWIWWSFYRFLPVLSPCPCIKWRSSISTDSWPYAIPFRYWHRNYSFLYHFPYANQENKRQEAYIKCSVIYNEGERLRSSRDIDGYIWTYLFLDFCSFWVVCLVSMVVERWWELRVFCWCMGYNGEEEEEEEIDRHICLFGCELIIKVRSCWGISWRCNNGGEEGEEDDDDDDEMVFQFLWTFVWRPRVDCEN